MRALVIAALLAIVPACGSDDAAKTDGASLGDLAAMTNDLSTLQSCAQVYACTTGAETRVELGTCAAAGTVSAQQLYMQLYQCALAQCMRGDAGAVDGGAGSCANVSDDSAGCSACVQAAGASAACGSELSACENA